MKLLKRLMCVLAVGILTYSSVQVYASDIKDALEKQIAKAHIRVQTAMNNLGIDFDYNRQKHSEEYREYLIAKLELDDLLYFNYLMKLKDLDLSAK